MILTATDHADDTGATLTLSANSGTATIFLSKFAGSNSERSWLNVGTIVGNGNLPLPSIGLGPYLALAANGSNISLPLSFRVTDGISPNHWRCMGAVREFVLSLALPQVSVNPDDHLLCKMPYRPELQFAFSARPEETAAENVVMYFPRTEAVQPADVNHNQVDYGVQILFLRKVPQKLIEGLPTLLDIREKVLSSLTISPLPDFPCIYDAAVVPGQLIIPDQWVKSYECTTMVVRCLTEVPIGIR